MAILRECARGRLPILNFPFPLLCLIKQDISFNCSSFFTVERINFIMLIDIYLSQTFLLPLTISGPVSIQKLKNKYPQTMATISTTKPYIREMFYKKVLSRLWKASIETTYHIMNRYILTKTTTFLDKLSHRIIKKKTHKTYGWFPESGHCVSMW